MASEAKLASTATTGTAGSPNQPGSTSGPQTPTASACALGAKCQDGDMTFLAEFNYFCGMKLNVREASMDSNLQEQSRRVISDVKPSELASDGVIDYSGSLIKHINEASLASDRAAPNYDTAREKLISKYWRKDSDPVPKDQTYSQYFRGDLSRADALAGLDRIVEGPFNNGTGSWFDSSQA
jgi:hypothetical protein